MVGDQVELDVLLPAEDGDALEDGGAEETQVQSDQITLALLVRMPGRFRRRSAYP